MTKTNEIEQQEEYFSLLNTLFSWRYVFLKWKYNTYHIINFWHGIYKYFQKNMLQFINLVNTKHSCVFEGVVNCKSIDRRWEHYSFHATKSHFLMFYIFIYFFIYWKNSLQKILNNWTLTSCQDDQGLSSKIRWSSKAWWKKKRKLSKKRLYFFQHVVCNILPNQFCSPDLPNHPIQFFFSLPQFLPLVSPYRCLLQNW